ncbi:heme-thiolate peroxidase [Phytophthora cinnamomi]|nr:heme-thiolate peroxidase [Phytophthora cinnamomi]
MVSFIAFSALAVASVAAGYVDNGQNAQVSIDALQVGDFYRPSSDEVTGYADSTSPVPFRRSPCPGLNALANHGHIPRSGKNITHENLGAALMSVFNFDSNLTQTLLNQVPATFSLDIISRHNVLEHDASLVHDDAYFGGDPININATLVENLLSRSRDGKTLGVPEVAETRRDRQARVPEPTTPMFIVGCGGNVNESVTVEAAHSFVWDERIPDNYVASAEPCVGNLPETGKRGVKPTHLNREPSGGERRTNLEATSAMLISKDNSRQDFSR